MGLTTVRRKLWNTTTYIIVEVIVYFYFDVAEDKSVCHLWGNPKKLGIYGCEMIGQSYHLFGPMRVSAHKAIVLFGQREKTMIIAGYGHGFDIRTKGI